MLCSEEFHNEMLSDLYQGYQSSMFAIAYIGNRCTQQPCLCNTHLLMIGRINVYKTEAIQIKNLSYFY